jgi:Cu(I)/Ag(I) efflux system membrane fusion protein
MNKRIWSVGAIAGAIGVIVGVAATRYLSQDHSLAENSPAPTAETQSSDQAADRRSLGQTLVDIQPVQLQAIRDGVRINGKLALNGMRLNQISSRLAGRVDKIMLFEGASVRAGEPVALLYSPEFISAQNELLLARNTVRMLSGKSTADLLEDANVTLKSARTKLKVQGAGEADIENLERSGVIQQHLIIRSPIAGRFIKRNVDPGGYLDTGGSLGTVADMSSLWFLGNAFEADLPRLREGQTVDITINGIQKSDPVRGRISFIAPTVDPQTHTVTVRVDLPNTSGLLKPDMFARADIALDQRNLPVVPRAAVVQDGAESFVVVQRDEKRFERISVDVVPSNDATHLAVTRGLKEGDRIVIEGSVLMDRSLTNPQAEKMPAGAKPGAGS